jgi:hypothetical protein
MHRKVKFSIVVLMVAALLMTPVGTMAAGPHHKDPQIEAGSMVADALIVRPLGIVAVVGGFGMFIVSAPFSLLGRNAGTAWNALVVYPAKFTFARPLGDFD